MQDTPDFGARRRPLGLSRCGGATAAAGGVGATWHGPQQPGYSSWQRQPGADDAGMVGYGAEEEEEDEYDLSDSFLVDGGCALVLWDASVWAGLP